MKRRALANPWCELMAASCTATTTIIFQIMIITTTTTTTTMPIRTIMAGPTTCTITAAGLPACMCPD